MSKNDSPISPMQRKCCFKKSVNLIEYFYVIGYIEADIEYYINQKQNNNGLLKEDNLKNQESNIDYPTILFSTKAKNDQIIDIDQLICQIYPEIPEIIPINSKIKKPLNENIIFFFTRHEKEKDNILYFYAYKFYEIYKIEDDKEFFIPKAFCICSKYSYFNVFRYICENLLIAIKQENSKLKYPEILMHCIANYIPSPLNYNINLDLFNKFLNSPSKIEIPQLTGYPYIDFDLREIFNIISVETLIKIFLLSLLEVKMFFFSKNHEILNMIMYIIYILNYPINNIGYFWLVETVSLDSFKKMLKNNYDSSHIEKIFKYVRSHNCFLGINASYENLDTNLITNDDCHYIIDLDCKNEENILIPKIKEERKEDKELIKLMELINKILNKNNEGSFLNEFISKLKNYLYALKNIKVAINPNNKNFFNQPSKDKNGKPINEKIQLVFYEFILDILMCFYKENKFIISNNPRFEIIKNKNTYFNLMFKIWYKDNEVFKHSFDLIPEEKYFLKKFSDTIKYKVYFENFIRDFKNSALNKELLLFCDEFIQMKLCERKNESHHKNIIPYFKIIDNYYPKQNNNKNYIKFDNIYSLFLQNDEKLLTSKFKSKSNLIFFDKNILNNFIYFIENNSEIKHSILQEEKDNEKTDVDLTLKSSISESILDYFQNKVLLSVKIYLSYIHIYIFALSLPLYSTINYLTFFENIKTYYLQNIRYFKKYFIYIIFKAIYKYFVNNKIEVDQLNTDSEIRYIYAQDYFRSLINFMETENILPNEEMIILLEKFFNLKIVSYKKEDRNMNIGIQNICKEEDQNYFSKNIGENEMINISLEPDNLIKDEKFIKLYLKEKEDTLINYLKKGENDSIKPKIKVVVKNINNDVFKYNLLFPSLIFAKTKKFFENFLENNDLNSERINNDEFKEIIANTVIYSIILGKIMFVKEDYDEKLERYKYLINIFYLLCNIDKHEKKNNDDYEYETIMNDKDDF